VAKETKMKKQVVRGVWAASLVGALALLSLPAEAGEISAKVPFSFEVAGKTLPPGIYKVSGGSDSPLIVRNPESGVFVLGTRLESSDHAAKLVFYRYGDRYLLRQVWMGTGVGRQLPETREERELISNARNGGRVASVERVVIQGF
jgi:hypothetical protein